jgi:hypothetical protein
MTHPRISLPGVVRNLKPTHSLPIDWAPQCPTQHFQELLVGTLYKPWRFFSFSHSVSPNKLPWSRGINSGGGGLGVAHDCRGMPTQGTSGMEYPPNQMGGGVGEGVGGGMGVGGLGAVGLSYGSPLRRPVVGSARSNMDLKYIVMIHFIIL